MYTPLVFTQFKQPGLGRGGVGIERGCSWRGGGVVVHCCARPSYRPTYLPTRNTVFFPLVLLPACARHLLPVGVRVLAYASLGTLQPGLSQMVSQFPYIIGALTVQRPITTRPRGGSGPGGGGLSFTFP